MNNYCCIFVILNSSSSKNKYKNKNNTDLPIGETVVSRRGSIANIGMNIKKKFERSKSMFIASGSYPTNQRRSSISNIDYYYHTSAKYSNIQAALKESSKLDSSQQQRKAELLALSGIHLLNSEKENQALANVSKIIPNKRLQNY